MATTEESFVIANEFAHVTVRKIVTPEGERIEISAPKRERVVRLSAETLWALAGEPAETFSKLLSEAPIGIKEQ